MYVCVDERRRRTTKVLACSKELRCRQDRCVSNSTLVSFSFFSSFCSVTVLQGDSNG